MDGLELAFEIIHMGVKMLRAVGLAASHIQSPYTSQCFTLALRTKAFSETLQAVCAWHLFFRLWATETWR